MTGTKLRQCLLAIADIFAEHAAVRMVLWLEPPVDSENDGGEWAAEVLVQCQRAMREALASKELQEIVSDIEDGAFDPDAAEAGR